METNETNNEGPTIELVMYRKNTIIKLKKISCDITKELLDAKLITQSTYETLIKRIKKNFNITQLNIIITMLTKALYLGADVNITIIENELIKEEEMRKKIEQMYPKIYTTINNYL